MTMYSNEKARTLDYGFAETGESTRLVTQFFHQVYLWMAIALVWTAIVSWAFATLPALRFTMTPGTILMASLGAFAVSIATSRIALRANIAVGLGLFMLYATLIGIAIAPIWAFYNYTTVGTAFALTGGIFMAMSAMGFVTKMDLSKVQSAAIMIVMGLFVGSIVNFFMASSMVSWMITYAVVIIFPILVMTETKQLKDFALSHGHDREMASKVAVLGSLMLYISFINIFMSILRIMGSRR